MAEFYTNVAVARDDILLRGYKDGKRVSKKVPYSPYLFTPTRQESKYRTLDGQAVGRIDFDTITEARQFLRNYNDVGGMPIYGLDKFAYTYIFDNYMRRGAIDYDPSLISVCTIDIEVSIANNMGFPDIQMAGNPVTLITMANTNKTLVLGCGDFDLDKVSDKDRFPDNVEYVKCVDEKALLRVFVDSWNSREFSPDVVTGWNVEFFDIPYLINRIRRVLGDEWAKRLSPWKYLQERRIEIMGKENQVFIPTGITILDYMQLYKKFAFKIQESYRLDHIAAEELGVKKLEYDGSLAELEVNDYQKYCEYNVIDVVLVQQLDDKLKLIELVYAMAYDAGVNYQDTFTTVGLWDTLIHNHLMRSNIVVPRFKPATHGSQIIGGYVKEPQVGLHHWVVSLDLNSLYPHIIMQYNISPETYKDMAPWSLSIDDLLEGKLEQEHRDHLKANDVAMTANMCQFSRDKQGFLPALMSKMYNDRKAYRAQMIQARQSYDLPHADRTQLAKDIARYDNLQMAKKIQLNSGYGALANVWNRWYRREFAEAITSSGQLTTRWIEGKLNDYLNRLFSTEDVDYVIACDTDSVYVKMDCLVNSVMPDETDVHKITRYLDKVCEQKLQPYIDKCYGELAEYMNAREQKMQMKRECIANKAIWTAKKRYILSVYNQEGVTYNEPKLKMMGIEAIRTSTPSVVRGSIKKALEIIMQREEPDLQAYVAAFRDEFSTLPFEAVAFPRSVRDLNKWKDGSSIYKKGTPINVKGALVFNDAIKRLKLDKKYQYVGDGQKIKYAYLKMPNPVQSTVITCPDNLPSELNLDKYIDRDKQFEKSFLEPIKTIVGSIGWEVEKRATLDQFFA